MTEEQAIAELKAKQDAETFEFIYDDDDENDLPGDKNDGLLIGKE